MTQCTFCDWYLFPSKILIHSLLFSPMRARVRSYLSYLNAEITVRGCFSTKDVIKSLPPSPFPHDLQVFLYKVTSNLLGSIYNCQYLLSRICHFLHSPNPPIEQFPPSILKDSQDIQVYLSQFHLLHQQSKNNQQGEQLSPWKLTFNTCKCLSHFTSY